MSVVDHTSENESKMTNMTNQTPFVRHLEPMLGQVIAAEYKINS